MDIIWNSRKSVSSDAIVSLNHNHTLLYTRNLALLREQVKKNGKFKIKGILVEIIGNFRQRLENGSWSKPTSLKHKEIIKFDDLEIPALGLNYEYKFYLRNSKNLRRLKETRKIKEYLDKK